MLYNSIYEFEKARHFMDRFFNAPGYSEESQVDYNLANVYENSDRYSLEFLAPGVKTEDISVDVSNGLLTVNLKRKQNAESQPQGTVLRKERGNFEFTRSWKLTDEANVEKIEARINEGILHVDIPKKEFAKPKKIEVKVS